MFMSRGVMSAKTILAPLKANALAVEAKVYEGMITSSPGEISQSTAAISSALVHECVKSALGLRVISSSKISVLARKSHRKPFARLSEILAASCPVIKGI